MNRIGRAGPKPLTWRGVRRIYTTWQMWLFIFVYVMVAQAAQGSSYFNLWLKAEGYTVVQVNTIPTAGNAFQVIASLFFGILADLTGRRGLMILSVCSPSFRTFSCQYGTSLKADDSLPFSSLSLATPRNRSLSYLLRSSNLTERHGDRRSFKATQN
jgi:MFS family permease